MTEAVAANTATSRARSGTVDPLSCIIKPPLIYIKAPCGTIAEFIELNEFVELECTFLQVAIARSKYRPKLRLITGIRGVWVMQAGAGRLIRPRLNSGRMPAASPRVLA
jgi:hypothetical protein